MSDPTKSIEPAYFEMVYAASADPWGFETSPYEAEKYAVMLAALPRERYASGFEIGCSLGVLRTQLAERCDTLLAVDVGPVERVGDIAVGQQCLGAKPVIGCHCFQVEPWPPSGPRGRLHDTVRT